VIQELLQMLTLVK